MFDYTNLKKKTLKDLLKNTENQPKELCLEAVKRDGFLLELVKNQTTEICFEAVKQNGYA